MEIIHKLDIDLLKPGAMQMVFAMQADENSRVLEISLSVNGEVWNIPRGISFSVAYLKPDKTRGIYDTLPDGTSAATFSENIVSVKLAPQMLTAHGLVQASVVMTDSGMNRLNTFPVTVNVIANPSVGATESKDYYSLTAIAAIGDLNDLETNDKSSVVAAINEILAGSSASDSSQNLILDNTLAVSGAAADAKATGDEIKRVEGLIPTKPEDIGALPDTYTPPDQTAEQVGADPKGTAASAVSAHNTSDEAHSDIRLLIDGLTTRLNALANSADTDLDQMAELVAYIKSNKSLIDSITTSKVSVSDIINNLTTNAVNKPLSAAQGVSIKALIDGLTSGKLDASKLSEAIDTALAQAKESGEFDGKDGEPGDPGKDGYTPVKGVDYYTEEDKAGYSKLIAAELARRGQLKPEFANSVEGCTDTSKLYVLPDNFLYAYMTRETSTEPTELYDPAAATLDERHSGTPGSVVSGAGYVMTDYIPVDMAASTPVLLKVTCNGFNATANEVPYFQKIAYYDSAKNCLGTKYLLASATKGSGAKLETSGNDTTIYVGYVEDGSQVTFYSQIAFVRIEVKGTNTSGATESDRNLITSIIDPNSGGITIETGWTNTGHAFVPADYEERIISLEHGVAKLQSGGSSEVTVPTFWEDAVDACIAKIKTLQVGRNCITFPFFSDNHQRNGYAGLLIAYIMKECNIPYAFFSGDSIDSGYIASEDVMIAQDKAFDTAMSYIPNGRFCRAVGNHDGYWAVDADNKNYYTDAQNYELFLREESIAQNKHFGGDGTYYYVDDVASKVRFVVLDTNDGTVETEQIEWLQNTALKFNESGWAVVIISHQPISNHYHANISNAAAVREIVAGIEDADVIGWFSGHIHRDRIYTGAATNTTDDTEGDAMGFTQVTITSDHTGIAYDAATKHTVANDDQSHAIDFVTINRNTRIVNMTRLGIGNDRSYTY